MKKEKVFYKTSGFRLFLLILPLLILVFCFSYLPLYGWIYALFDYKPGVPLFNNKFVGLDNFTRIVKDSYYRQDVLRVLKNTLGMNLLAMITSPLSMLFAVFLSEIKCIPFKKTTQTLTTIPNFISWVLVYAVAYAMFSVNDGFINKVLINMGILDEGINFLASSDHIWIKMWLWSQWKGLGWSAIVYIAAISGIDQEQYEAAEVDGANRFQKMRYVTIPGLLPTFFVLLVLSIGNMVNNGMEQYFVFQNAMNKEHIEVLDLYVYNQGMVGINYSYSTAVSILKSIVSVTLLFFSNQLSKLIRGESVF